MKVLLHDYRRGGVERCVVIEDDVPIMYLPELVQKSAVIIGDGHGPLGSGVLLQAKTSSHGRGFKGYTPSPGPDEAASTYVVTAAHNVNSLVIRKEDATVTFLKADGSSGVFTVRASEWVFHTEGPVAVDAAVAEIPEGRIGINHSNTVVDYDDLATDAVIEGEGIGPGDHLYFAGLFSRLLGTSHVNRPIVRTGTIAMMPHPQPIETFQRDLGPIKVYAYLIETRSIGGLSGSPVFVDTSGVRVRNANNRGPDDPPPEPYALQNPRTFFFGLIRGHWNLEADEAMDAKKRGPEIEADRINTGIAMVVPAHKIYELITQESLVKKRREQKAREMKGKAPTLDSARPNVEPKDENQRAKSMVDQIAKRTEGKP